jgi:RNA polymerase sigma factor (sigma-70 family)
MYLTPVTSTTTIIDDHGALITWAERFMHVALRDHEDAAQGGAVGLLTALDRYDPSRGAFRPFAASHVLAEVRNAVGWTRRCRTHLVELDGPEVEPYLKQDDEGYESSERREAIVVTRAFVDALSTEDQYLYRRLYVDELTQTEVARELGVSKMTVSRREAKLHARGRRQLAAFAPAA